MRYSFVFLFSVLCLFNLGSDKACTTDHQKDLRIPHHKILHHMTSMSQQEEEGFLSTLDSCRNLETPYEATSAKYEMCKVDSQPLTFKNYLQFCKDMNSEVENILACLNLDENLKNYPFIILNLNHISQIFAKPLDLNKEKFTSLAVTLSKLDTEVEKYRQYLKDSIITKEHFLEMQLQHMQLQQPQKINFRIERVVVLTLPLLIHALLATYFCQK